MLDEEYNLERAEKLIKSIKKDLTGVFLHSQGKTLAKWFDDFKEYLEYQGINDIRSTALTVVIDVNGEYETQIGRALEAIRILLQQVNQLKADYAKVEKVANAKLDERDSLKRMIDSLQITIDKIASINIKEPEQKIIDKVIIDKKKQPDYITELLANK